MKSKWHEAVEGFGVVMLVIVAAVAVAGIPFKLASLKPPTTLVVCPDGMVYMDEIDLCIAGARPVKVTQ